MVLTNTTPSAAVRISSLDIIRGFTIGGILFANILWLSGFLELSADIKATLASSFSDQAVLFLIRLLVHGKFYYIFAFLFGLGFAILMERAVAKGQNFTAFFCLRLFILFLIGVVHSLCWWGDIVRYYALFGFTLLLFRHLNNRQLLVGISLMLLIPPLMKSIAFYWYPDFKPVELVSQSKDQMLAFYQDADFRSWFTLNLQQIGDHFIKNSWSGRWFKILGMFLSGLLVGRLDLFRRVEELEKLLKKTLLISFFLGLLSNLARVSLYYTNYGFSKEVVSLLRELIYFFAVPSLAIFYVTVLMLLCQSANYARLLQPLVAVGRTSLTNYVGQTLVCMVIFRPYFLGYYGQLHLTTCALLACLVFIMQIGLSNLWMRYYLFGPLEWFWRSLNYWKWQPIKRV